MRFFPLREGRGVYAHLYIGFFCSPSLPVRLFFDKLNAASRGSLLCLKGEDDGT